MNELNSSRAYKFSTTHWLKWNFSCFIPCYFRGLCDSGRNRKRKILLHHYVNVMFLEHWPKGGIMGRYLKMTCCLHPWVALDTVCPLWTGHSTLPPTALSEAGHAASVAWKGELERIEFVDHSSHEIFLWRTAVLSENVLEVWTVF